MVFGPFGGVSKFKSTFGAPWSIFGEVDQPMGPLRSVGSFENSFGISAFHFEFITINHIVLLNGFRTLQCL